MHAIKAVTYANQLFGPDVTTRLSFCNEIVYAEVCISLVVLNSCHVKIVTLFIMREHDERWLLISLIFTTWFIENKRRAHSNYTVIEVYPEIVFRDKVSNNNSPWLIFLSPNKKVSDQFK